MFFHLWKIVKRILLNMYGNYEYNDAMQST